MCNAIQEIIGLAIEATKTGDMNVLKEIEPLEEVVDRLVEELKAVHIDRSKNGLCNIEVGVNFLDILTNVERISDHCSNIAVYLIANREKYNSLKSMNILISFTETVLTITRSCWLNIQKSLRFSSGFAPVA